MKATNISATSFRLADGEFPLFLSSHNFTTCHPFVGRYNSVVHPYARPVGTDESFVETYKPSVGAYNSSVGVYKPFVETFKPSVGTDESFGGTLIYRNYLIYK